MRTMGSPTVRTVAAQVMVGAIMVLLQLSSACASVNDGRLRNLGAPLPAPVDSPVDAPFGLPLSEPLCGTEVCRTVPYEISMGLSRRGLYDIAPYSSPPSPPSPPPPSVPYNSPPSVPYNSPPSVPYDSPPAPPSVAKVPSTSGSSSSKSQVGLIAGVSVTIGVIIGAIVVGLVLFCRSKSKNSEAGDLPQEKRPNPAEESFNKRPSWFTGKKSEVIDLPEDKSPYTGEESFDKRPCP